MNTSQFCLPWLCENSEAHIEGWHGKAGGSQFWHGALQQGLLPQVSEGRGSSQPGEEPARICLKSASFLGSPGWRWMDVKGLGG